MNLLFVVKKVGSLQRTGELVEFVGQALTQTEYVKALKGSAEMFDMSGPGK